MNRLPPLNALRCFEATARHMSIAGAAAELHVTAGAVSQQIRNVEETLGLRLFERRPRALVLTPEGQRYFPSVRNAFRILAEATESLRAERTATTLTVSCTTGFALQWLLPRLPRFAARAPGVDVRIGTTNRLVDFERDGVDVAVRHGLGRYPGLRSERLIDDDLIVVCSPALAARKPPLRRPDDLRHHVLLHDEHRDDWRLWLRAAGARGVDWSAGPVFTESNAVIEGAVAGHGVALVRASLVERELAAGRLARPFRRALRSAFAYYLVYPAGNADRVGAAAFRTWLLDEAAAGRNRARAKRP